MLARTMNIDIYNSLKRQAYEYVFENGEGYIGGIGSDEEKMFNHYVDKFNKFNRVLKRDLERELYESNMDTGDSFSSNNNALHD